MKTNDVSVLVRIKLYVAIEVCRYSEVVKVVEQSSLLKELYSM